MYKVLWDVETLDDIDSKTLLLIKKKIDSYLAQARQELGKPLTGNYKGLYRYRYGDYRIIYEILNTEKTIIIVKIGHRKNIYNE